ncbi:MAG TPA: endonuclease/exonuclease/phosphatase family protein [Kofleriaceae bacterium]|nr:endonuclease/exonuclease/phosphatase family protein [Kofleriaceae bacterium]
MGTNLRVVTLNFWGTEPPLDRRIALAVRQLKALDPDVVCLQEARPLDGVSGRTTADVLGEALGMHAHYSTSCAWKAGEYEGLGDGQEGLAILSKAKPLATQRIELPHGRVAETRQLLSAQLPTDAAPVWVHTTHLHYRLDDGVAREAQVLAIDDAMRALGRDKTSAPQILCGDFNATPDSDEMRFLRGLTTLGGRRTHFQDAWLRHHRECQPGDGHAQGITWSSENELTRPLRSLDIDRRIDYIYVTSRKKDGRATIHDCRVTLTDREDPGGICASDHYALVADVQVA